MMDDLRRGLHTYLRQQQELGAPDYILSAPLKMLAVSESPRTMHSSAKPPAQSFSTGFAPTSPVLKQKRDRGLVPAAHLHGSHAATAASASGPDPVRDALVKLFTDNKTCTACGLSNLRKNFVFGSGNAHAPLMVIGEAPGADEDEQGLPFVGKAGELLTKMLAAIQLDRKKDVFIANVLKCRPPENRNPEATEIMACKHILMSQIDIIKPKVILLLGRIAAHTLLESTASIASLRLEPHSVRGTVAFVTYHPASLLRNEEYKRPAWEDMLKLKQALSSAGVYADQTI